MCEFDGDINSGSDSTLDTVDDTPQNEYPEDGLWGPDSDYYGDGSYEGMWDEDTSAEETNERAREELDEFNRQQQEDAAEEEEEQERMQEEEAEEQERMREEEEELDLSEIPLGEMTGTQMKQYAEQLGLETEGLRKRDLRELIRNHLK